MERDTYLPWFLCRCLHQLQDASLAVCEETELGAGDQSTRQVTGRILADALACITAIPAAEPTEAELVAMETLYDAHHPCIGWLF